MWELCNTVATSRHTLPYAQVRARLHLQAKQRVGRKRSEHAADKENGGGAQAHKSAGTSSGRDSSIGRQLLGEVAQGLRPSTAALPHKLQVLLATAWADAPEQRCSADEAYRAVHAMARARDVRQ